MTLHSEQTHNFVKLLTGHQPALRAFIVSLMPGSPDIQDVLQDTNLVLWEKMGHFEEGTNFRAWAFAIARNMVKASHRMTQRNQAPVLNEKIIQAVCETWYQRAPEESCRKQLALDHCLKGLSDSEREMVDARYGPQDEWNAYADLIGRSTASLRVSLCRIRTKLRECVRRRCLIEGGAQ